MKKDKAKVLDEVLDEARIREFLSLEAPAGENADFHCLEKAYRGMPAQYFETFIKLFVEEGRDIDARSSEGRTIMDVLKTHQSAEDYRNIIKNAQKASA